MKKRFVLLLAAAMTVGSLVGCSGGNETSETTVQASGAEGEESVSGDEINVRVEIGADPGDLSPWGVNTNESQYVKYVIYQRLLEKDYSGELVPLLAKEYEQIDDTHYRFVINEGITVHNGDTLTASDVVWSIKMAAESATYSNITSGIDVENTEVVDDTTFILALESPSIMAIENMCWIPITSQSAYESDPDHMVNNPVGTGPYKFVEWTPGSTVEVEKFDGYWRPDSNEQNCDRITYRVISETAQKAIELETDGVDVLYEVGTGDVERLKGDENFTVIEETIPTVHSIYFNCSEYSACQNQKLRQAIAYAVDTESIAEVAYGGYATPAYSICSEAFSDWKDEYKEDGILYAQDLEKARQLLAEAGIQEGLELSLITNEDATRVAAAEIIQANLAQIGIQVNITSYEAAVYNTMILDPQGGWDMSLNGATNYGSVLGIFHFQLNYKTSKRMTLIDEHFQELLEEALAYGDEAVTDELLDYFNETLPIYPMVHLEQICAAKNTIGDFALKGSRFLFPGEWDYSNWNQ